MKKTQLLGIVALISLVALVTIPFLIPMENYRGEMEQALSEKLGQPVTVDDLRVSILPVAGVTAHGVAIGDEGKLDAVVVELALMALLFGEIEIPSVRINGGELPVATLGALAGGEEEGEAAVTVKEVRVRNLALLHGDNRLGPFMADIPLGGEVGFYRTELRQSDNSLQLALLPTGQGIELSLSLVQWTFPLDPPLVIDRLQAAGTLHDGRVKITKVDAEAYQGTLSGDGEVSWREGWRVDQRFDVQGVELEPLLKALGHERKLAGKLDAKGTLALAAVEPAALADNPTVDTDFVINQGVLFNADLEKAAKSLATSEQQGGDTPFDQLKGHLRLENNDLTATQVSITSESLEAKGDVKATGMQALAGEVNVGLKGAAMIAGIPLKVSGTVDEPSLRLTDEAIAGAGAGTAILGPGLGTAVGIKAGQLFKGITRAITSDDEKKD